MKIFGKETSREEIHQKTGDISQLGGIKYYEMIDGVSRGVRGIDIKSPCGLDMTVLPDRGMDISSLSYMSTPIAWRSATRETSNAYYESSNLEWLRTFFGGLVTTCGLTYMGAPDIDEGEELGLHGRISNISAENVLADGKWEGDSYKMWVQGKVREAKVFGDKLELERKITTWMDQPRVILEDVVENIGSQTSPLMVLYHINIGYPVVDEGAILLEPEAKVTARDEEAEKGIENYSRFDEPVKGYTEQVFFHEIGADDEGNGNIAIANEAFSNGSPCLTQWKQMGMGEYVCGIEPGNSYPRGRSIEKKENNIRYIEPGERVNFRLEFNILKSNEDIENFKKTYM